MQNDGAQNGRVRRTVNDLVMAEMFLVQATIESATVIGDGISQLGKQMSTKEEKSDGSWDAISSTLQDIADAAMEPYISRYSYFRKMIDVEK